MLENFKEESTDARNWGGVTRSSEEAAVMGVERRGYIRLSNFYTTEQSEGNRESDKTFNIPKQTLLFLEKIAKEKPVLFVHSRNGMIGALA